MDSPQAPTSSDAAVGVSELDLFLLTELINCGEGMRMIPHGLDVRKSLIRAWKLRRLRRFGWDGAVYPLSDRLLRLIEEGAGKTTEGLDEFPAGLDIESALHRARTLKRLLRAGKESVTEFDLRGGIAEARLCGQNAHLLVTGKSEVLLSSQAHLTALEAALESPADGEQVRLAAKGYLETRIEERFEQYKEKSLSDSEVVGEALKSSRPSARSPLPSPEGRTERKEKGIARIFGETLGLVRIVLVAHYEVEEFAAVELEKGLAPLLHRYCKYMDRLPVKKCREFLVKKACERAHEYQKYFVGTGRCRASGKLLGLLERGPAQAAQDFAESLALFEYCPHASAEEAFEHYGPIIRERLYGPETHRLAEEYLSTPIEGRGEQLLEKSLSDSDVLFTVCDILRGDWNVSPASVAAEASLLYRWLAVPDRGKAALHEHFRQIASGVGSDPAARRSYYFEDELHEFRGETAFLAAGAYRLLGRHEETERYLDYAQAAYGQTLAPEQNLAQIAYVRLAYRYELRLYDQVFQLVPSVVAMLTEFGMELQVAKCRLIEAMALKLSGKIQEARAVLDALRFDTAVKADVPFHGRVLIELGDVCTIEGRSDAAMAVYQKALPMLQQGECSVALADLKLYIGAAFRAQGRLGQAIEAFRAGQRDFQALEMAKYACYLGLMIAETFLAMERPIQAEREILAALPIIEGQKLVPEGFAALALLRESVARRNTDLEALHQLREHLRPKS